MGRIDPIDLARELLEQQPAPHTIVAHVLPSRAPKPRAEGEAEIFPGFGDGAVFIMRCRCDDLSHVRLWRQYLPWRL
ncbi:hypothetical protein GCM10027419_41100 [Pandoraea terrae]